MGYGITIRTPTPFAAAIARVREALKAQGFRGHIRHVAHTHALPAGSSSVPADP